MKSVWGKIVNGVLGSTGNTNGKIPKWELLFRSSRVFSEQGALRVFISEGLFGAGARNRNLTKWLF